MNDDAVDKSRIVDHEPWLADKSSFLISSDREYIVRTMQYLKDNHVPLTLVVDGSDIFQQSLVFNIADGTVQMDKPLEWGDGVDSFRVFFNDMYHKWNFFLVSNLPDTPFSLSVTMPDELFFFQKRSCNRVVFPPGTRALVKRENEAMSTVFVHDLSSAGMLICNDPADGEYDKDSIISDIVVSIPSCGDNGGGRARKVLPLISRGQIVRSFLDKESQRPCYGVSFQYDSSYVEETISQMVADVERDA